MSFLKRIKPAYIALGILLVAALFVRLHLLGDKSLSNDELSALSRLHKDADVHGEWLSFNELMTVGVRPDYHPAGVQVLMWIWVRIFGEDPFSVRLPFALMGVLSILLFYLIGSKWFGQTAGLYGAILLSLAEFPLLYSQIARPYSAGLFTSLLLVWVWNLLLSTRSTETKRLWTLSVCYGVATALCMYDHYFCFLFAFIVGLTGLLIAGRNKLVFLLTGAGIAILLFLPHLGITIEQLGRGGLSTWLGPPPDNSLWKLILYVFNGSGWILLAITGITILAAGSRGDDRWKYRTICLFWFFSLWAVAHYYSVWINPVFQFSILIFSAFWLPLFIFSFTYPKLRARQWIGGLLLAGLLSWSTFINIKYYQTLYFGTFSDLATAINNWIDRYDDDITFTTNVNGRFYLDYYLEQPVDFKMTHVINTGESLSSFEQTLKESDSRYFAHSWSTKFNPYEIDPLIRKYYPVVVDDRQFFNSGVTLYERGKTFNPTPVFDTTLVFGNDVILDSVNAYSKALLLPSIIVPEGSLITVMTEVEMDDSTFASLVLAAEGDGLEPDWYGMDIEPFSTDTSVVTPFLVRKLPADLEPGHLLKAYVWHRGGNPVRVKWIRVYW